MVDKKLIYVVIKVSQIGWTIAQPVKTVRDLGMMIGLKNPKLINYNRLTNIKLCLKVRLRKLIWVGN